MCLCLKNALIIMCRQVTALTAVIIYSWKEGNVLISTVNFLIKRSAVSATQITLPMKMGCVSTLTHSASNFIIPGVNYVHRIIT